MGGHNWSQMSLGNRPQPGMAVPTESQLKTSQAQFLRQQAKLPLGGTVEPGEPGLLKMYPFCAFIISGLNPLFPPRGKNALSANG